ncbi:MAG TPA: ABC transporter substrate-binding protein [Candidatus Binatia bacterium]
MYRLIPSRSALIILFLITCLLSLPAIPVNSDDKIRISISNAGGAFSVAGVALKRGYFDRERLNVELIQMRGNISMNALYTGAIDYTILFGSVVRATLQGLPFKVLASFINGPGNVLVAKSAMKSPAELKAKTIAISSFGAGVHVTAELLIQNFGVNPEQVKFLALGEERARFAALQNGIVDAAMLTPVLAAKAKSLGFSIVSAVDPRAGFPFGGLAATDKKISQSRGEVKAVLKALIGASRYIRADRAGTIQALMEWTRSDLESATALYDVIQPITSEDGLIPDKGFQVVVDQARRELNTTKNVSLDELRDESILREALTELKPKQR